MTGDLEQLLRNLRLTKVLEIYDETARQADEHGLSYSELLTQLLRAQWHARQDSALAWQVKQAALPQQWTLESFPWKLQPGVTRRQIQGLAELDFVAKAENVVFIGPPGVGKTGLATGLLLKAIQNGCRGRFVKAQDLFDEMYASLADRSSRKLVNQLARLDVLLVDSC
jgi:DNA replication protein DnaC